MSACSEERAGEEEGIRDVKCLFILLDPNRIDKPS
jgi:hypothetical protein